MRSPSTTSGSRLAGSPAPGAWACLVLSLVLFLYLIGIPSSQASGVPLLQEILLDWDEVDPAEDKGLPSLSDDQPDLAAGSPLLLTRSYPGFAAPACASPALSSVRPSSSGTRAPPVG